MSYELASPVMDMPNIAPAQGLERYLDRSGAPQKPFPEWIKTTTQRLEQQDSIIWDELTLVWQLINLFIEGKQILRRRHRGFGWDVIPLPESTTANIREQNKLGFYFRVLQSKWVASRTKIDATPGDDSDESIEAAKMADVWLSAIEPMIYSERFRQEEAVAAPIHGTYARYFWYDKDAEGGYGQRAITQPGSIKLGEDTAECFDCGYTGSPAEFQNNRQTGAVVQPEQVRAGMPGMAGEPSAQADLGQNEGTGRDIGGIGAGGHTFGAEISPAMELCPQCGSATIQTTPAIEQPIEAVTGVEKYKLGNLRGISVPYSQIRHEISCSLESSPWSRWKRRIRIEVLKEAYKGLKMPTPDATSRDSGLAYEEAMRRSTAVNKPTTSPTDRKPQEYGDFTQWWLAPCMYADYVFPADTVTVAGETIPAGTKAMDIFPDGMYVAIVEGIDQPLQVCNESHKWHWVTAPYHLRLFSGLGLGIQDSVEMQRQWNLILSLVFTQIRTAALPGWLYDKDAIENDGVKRLGQPQNSVPVSLRNRPEGTRIEQLVHQMPPGQIPSHIPWYVGQLDSNMQTSAGALVNEGVPGIDSHTATGVQQMVGASQQHNAPEFALKGDADVRSAYVLFELSKKHYVEPRFLPISGKRGKQGGMWLSAADLRNGQVRFEAVRDTWMPNTRMDKQEAIKGLLLTFGGMLGLMQAKDAMPAFVAEVAESFGVDIEGDIYEPATLLFRQRMDQISELAEMYEPIAMQMAEMAAQGYGEIDPVTGMPVDPMMVMGQQIVEELQPPIELEEPTHLISVNLYRESFLDDEMKEAKPLKRAAVKAAIRKHLLLAAEEQQMMAQLAIMSQPPMSPVEEAGDKPEPKKTENDQRKANARSNMSGKHAGMNPQPQRGMHAASQ